MEWKKIYEVKRRTPEEAVKLVRSGDRVFIGSASSIAWKLAEALYARRDELENVVILHGLTPRVLPFFLPEAKGHFSTISYFAGFGGRAGIQNGQTQFTSIHLSEIRTWCHEVARPNVAFFEVSPPDENGYMSYGAFGTSFHDYVKEQAGTVLLQVNRNAPRVFGENNRIHITEADYVTEADDELWEIPDLPVDDTIRTLSGHIVELIPDGATLQLGLGGIANAVGYGLKDHNDLGIHTEMLSDSMMELMKSGVTLVDPDSTVVDPLAVIGEDTVIEPFSVIKGKTVIGIMDCGIESILGFDQQEVSLYSGRKFNITAIGGKLLTCLNCVCQEVIQNDAKIVDGNCRFSFQREVRCKSDMLYFHFS